MSDAAVLSRPPDGAGGPDIDAEIAEIAGGLNAQHGRLVAAVRRALDTGSWQADGIHSPTQWLARRVGLSPPRAQEILRCAERRHESPAVSAMFARGELAVDQVVALMRAPAWADEHLAEFATVATVGQLRKTMTSRFFDEGSEPAPAEPATEVHDRLSTSVDESGRRRVR